MVFGLLFVRALTSGDATVHAEEFVALTASPSSASTFTDASEQDTQTLLIPACTGSGVEKAALNTVSSDYPVWKNVAIQGPLFRGTGG